MKILVIGLGQIGYHDAEYMTGKGLLVHGYDISEVAAKRAKNDGVIKEIASDFSGYDCYVIAISTHASDDMSTPFIDGILDVANKLLNEGKTGSLVTIESTITMGTSQKIQSILQHRMHVVHAPHRFYINEKELHGVNQTRVLGGCDSCCVEEGIHFYEHTLKIPIHKVSSIQIAELSKIVENSYRFLEIAFAEELKMFCDNASLNFTELRNAINTKWNVQILEPRDGIGGHCLPKDSQMFLNLEKSWLSNSLVMAAQAVDRDYRMHLVGVMTPTVTTRTSQLESNAK